MYRRKRFDRRQMTFSYSTRYTGKRRLLVAALSVIIAVFLIVLLLLNLNNLMNLFRGDLPEETEPGYTEQQPETDSTKPESETEQTKLPMTQETLQAVTLSAEQLADESAWGQLLDNASAAQNNAVCVVLKNEAGMLGYQSALSEYPFLQEVTATGAIDLAAFCEQAHEKNLYVIGRIACFYDNIAPRRQQNMAVKTQGVPWLDYDYHSWISPYSTEGTSYLCGLIGESVDAGVDGLLLDSVTFPTVGKLGVIQYENDSAELRTQAVTQFLQQARTVAEGHFLMLRLPVQQLSDSANPASGLTVTAAEAYCDFFCPGTDSLTRSYAGGVLSFGETSYSVTQNMPELMDAAVSALRAQIGQDTVILPCVPSQSELTAQTRSQGYLLE